MNDFSGRTALITGGSDGIGLEIARVLAAAGARVLLPVRNRAKGERAAAAIRHDHPEAQLELHHLDLARLSSVEALVSDLESTGEAINMLILNAGVVQLGIRARTVTADGFELTFQTNFLGHFKLTHGLMPLLQAGRARIVVQCSIAAAGARISWDDLRGERAYHPYRAYRSSKTALGLFGVELSRRLTAVHSPMSVQLCHPGVAPGSAIAPNLRELLPPRLLEWGTHSFGNSPRDGALTAIAASNAPASTEPHFYVPAGWAELYGPPRMRRPYQSLLREGDARLLWRIAEDAAL